MQGSASRPGHSALREGLMFGTILGILGIVSGLLQNFVGLHSLNTVYSVLFLVLTIAMILLAGVRASQQTGRVSTGAFAGLIVELTSSVFGFLNILADVFVYVLPTLPGARRAACAEGQDARDNLRQIPGPALQ